MDSQFAAAARALSRGDPLGALNRVALRDDAPALTLLGITMAQLGDLVRARAFLQRALRAFGPKEVVPRARCVVSEADIALASPAGSVRTSARTSYSTGSSRGTRAPRRRCAGTVYRCGVHRRCRDRSADRGQTRRQSLRTHRSTLADLCRGGCGNRPRYRPFHSLRESLTSELPGQSGATGTGSSASLWFGQ
jgi:hypothetical protein